MTNDHSGVKGGRWRAHDAWPAPLLMGGAESCGGALA